MDYELLSGLFGDLGAYVGELVLLRIRRLLEKTCSMSCMSPGALSEVTEVGTLKPRRIMSLKNSVQHASDSLLPTAR